MELNQQVCSLELAKQLKELGVKQESLYEWWQNKNGTGDVGLTEWKSPVFRDRLSTIVYTSAFTVVELGKLLPAFLKLTSGYSGWLEIRPMPNAEGNGWQIGYTSQPSVIDYRHWEKTEADARAAMLTYLIENKLINPNNHE